MPFFQFDFIKKNLNSFTILILKLGITLKFQFLKQRKWKGFEFKFEIKCEINKF